MSDIDPKAVMDAWIAAKKALDATEAELNAAKAGHDVALRCERDAWAAIAKLCGREPIPPAPPQAPPVAAVTVFPAPPATRVISTMQAPVPSFYTQFHSGTGYMDTRAIR